MVSKYCSDESNRTKFYLGLVVFLVLVSSLAMGWSKPAHTDRNSTKSGISVNVNDTGAPQPSQLEILPGVTPTGFDCKVVQIPFYGRQDGKLVAFVTAERMTFRRGSGKMDFVKPRLWNFGEKNNTYMEGDFGEAEVTEAPFGLDTLHVWGNTKIRVREIANGEGVGDSKERAKSESDAMPGGSGAGAPGE